MNHSATSGYTPQTAPPQQSYAAWLADRLDQARRQVGLAAQAESRWSLARLGAFGFAVVAWIPVRYSEPIAGLLLAMGVGLFGLTLRRHARARERHNFLKLEQTVLEESHLRLGGRVVAVRANGRPGDSPVLASSPDALLPAGRTWRLSDQERDDLDLYATPVGLFGLLNRTSTDAGAMRLRDCLENLLLEPPRIIERQRAVRWLAERHEARLCLLAALAGLRRLDDQMLLFDLAVQEARPVMRRLPSMLLRLWSVPSVLVTLTGLWLAAWGDMRLAGPVGILIVLNFVLLSTFWLRVRRALQGWQRSAPLQQAYLRVAQEAARELPEQTPLATLRQAFADVCRPAALPGALRWVNWSASGGLAHLFANLIAFYDLHMIEGVLRHVLPHRQELRRGLVAAAELEALASLACFAAEQPDGTWPEPVADLRLQIHAGRHPLIEPTHAVPNDIQMAGQPRLWIITGSNMSGKSTFLRMAGVNVVLAQIGSFVPAGAMRFSPVRLLTDLRIRDDIEKGESYFLAEVRQLRRMVAPADDTAPILGLIDEPFRGTNHQEQRAATLAVVEHLGRAAGLFLIATHDRAVTTLADGTVVQNRHFQEELGRHEMLFDYRLRPGPAVTRNALRVLEREGYPESLTARAHHYVTGDGADL